VLDYPQKASCLSKILIRVFALVWNLWRGPYGQVDEHATIRPSGTGLLVIFPELARG
jgi:hypothetical protein